MDKYFSSAYRGDPGVPHADPHRFVNIWFGCLAFTASNCINPYYWHIGSSSFKYLSIPFILFIKPILLQQLIVHVCFNSYSIQSILSYAQLYYLLLQNRNLSIALLAQYDIFVNKMKLFSGYKISECILHNHFIVVCLVQKFDVKVQAYLYH